MKFKQLWGTDHHPNDVEKACRDSMKDLKVDYLDLYLIHWPTPFEVICMLFKDLLYFILMQKISYINMCILQQKKTSFSYTYSQKDGDEMWPKHEDGSFRYADEIEITETWRAMEQLVLKGIVL